MAFKFSAKTTRAADVVGQAADIIGQVATTAITVVGQQRNERLKQQLAEDLQKMSVEQANLLNARLEVLTSADDKYNEIVSFLSKNLGSQRSSALASMVQYQYMNKSQSDKKLIWYVLGGSIAFIVLAVVIVKLKKNKK